MQNKESILGALFICLTLLIQPTTKIHVLKVRLLQKPRDTELRTRWQYTTLRLHLRQEVLAYTNE